MKLYTFPIAPNPRKLNTYLGEKRLRIPQQLLVLPRGEHRTPEMLAKNPMGGVPFLELDDGTLLTESLPIIEYLEELHPDPPMIGTTPVERARTRRIERICDLGVFVRVARYVHSTKSPLGLPPNPPVAAAMLEELPGPLAFLDGELECQPFLAGDRPSIADCTLFGIWEFARFLGAYAFPPEYEHLHRWHADFSGRPSASWNPDPAA